MVIEPSVYGCVWSAGPKAAAVEATTAATTRATTDASRTRFI
jgi:hypothetical protein